QVIEAWLSGSPAQVPVQTRTVGVSPQQDEVVPPQGKTAGHLDQAVRNKLNHLYVRAKKLGICASDRQFVSYVRRRLPTPRLHLKEVTLEVLACVDDELIAQERAKDLEQTAVD